MQLGYGTRYDKRVAFLEEHNEKLRLELEVARGLTKWRGTHLPRKSVFASR